jgi:type II secretory pathway component PulF
MDPFEKTLFRALLNFYAFILSCSSLLQPDLWFNLFNFAMKYITFYLGHAAYYFRKKKDTYICKVFPYMY